MAVVVGRLEPALEPLWHLRLIRVGDLPELGKRHLRAVGVHNAVLDAQRAPLDLQQMGGQRTDLVAQARRCTVHGANVIQMKVVATVGGRDAPG